MEIFKLFGVQWAPFVAQVIVILVVYVILNKYAFGPVMAVLEQRRRKIAEGEENLKRIKSDLAKAEERVQGMLDKANQDAERLISEARQSAEGMREQKTQAAILEAGQIIAKARDATLMERERVLSELKADFGRLVIGATSKVSGKILNDSDQRRINEEVAGQVSL